MSKTLSESDIAERILHVLAVYPQISPSMLQVSLNIAAGSWKPVLERLITDGQIVRKTLVSPTPTGRHQSYTILASTEQEVFDAV